MAAMMATPIPIILEEQDGFNEWASGEEPAQLGVIDVGYGREYFRHDLFYEIKDRLKSGLEDFQGFLQCEDYLVPVLPDQKTDCDRRRHRRYAE